MIGESFESKVSNINIKQKGSEDKNVCKYPEKFMGAHLFKEDMSYA